MNRRLLFESIRPAIMRVLREDRLRPVDRNTTVYSLLRLMELSAETWPSRQNTRDIRTFVDHVDAARDMAKERWTQETFLALNTVSVAGHSLLKTL